MAASGDETRRPATTNGKSESTAPLNAAYYQFPTPAEPVQYKNAREYAQALRPWLWQYYTMTAMQQFMSLCPPPCFQANQFPTNSSAISGSNFQQQQANHLPPRPPQAQTTANGHVPTPHRFPGEAEDNLTVSDPDF